MEKVFERTKDFGFKTSDTKCEFFMTSIKYFGHIIDANGRKPDSEMCFALKSMPPPTNVSTLRDFQGLVDYDCI